jgi:MYXO-CTERM domain-containing protein
MRGEFAAVILCLGAAAAPCFADEHLVRNPNGPLAGKTVVVSPGHGHLLDGGTWRYQRGVTHELREDIHTNEIVTVYLQRLLLNAGARVESVRERSFNPHEAIVDNGAAAYRETGAWTTSISSPEFYGSNYRYAPCAAQATATAEFAPTLPAAGRYPVYVWFTKGANRARDARYVVHHTGGQSTVLVDQADLGDHWLFLGEFHFDRTGGKVVVSNQGADATKVVIADAVRFGGGVGPSGAPRWRESAHAFLAHKGFSSGSGDVTIRPIYATYLAGGSTTTWRNDYLYFALHSNASNGSATGLSTFSYSNGRTPSWDSAGPAHYPTSPSPLTAASDRLRSTIHGQVLRDVRATHNPSWNDRGVHLMNFGELREARNMPSTLLELGFHDAAADAAYLRRASFREAAARAIYKGILRYWSATAAVLPLAPDGLRLENLGGGQVRARWNAVQDPLEPSAAPTSYKVYVSRDGRGFDDGVVVSGQEHTLTAVTGLVFVRVAALNAGGESLPTRVGGARAGDPGSRVLVVDGFDREFRHTEWNIQGRFTYDYSVEHVTALAASIPDRAIDYAQNEAITRGAVALSGYALVDWLLGRESGTDRTFDPTEQTLAESYVQGGGTVLVSGTDVAWDLQAQGGGARFLNDVLGAAYVADDSGTFVARGRPGGPWAALPLLVCDDGTSGRYAALSTDVLAPRGAAQALLSYDAANAPAAGVGIAGKSVVLGFPIESVTSDGARQALVREAVSYLAPTLLTPLATGPVTGGGGTSGGGSTAPVGTSGTTAPGATPAQQTGGGGGGGGGCSMSAASSTPASGGVPWLVALVALVALRRRSRG